MTEQHSDLAVPTAPTHLAVFQHPEGPAALYINGAIAFIGTDPADIFRRALDAAGVKVEDSERFLLGNTLPQDVSPDALFELAAPTFDSIERFSSVQEQVTALREEAARLAAEADSLEASLREAPLVEETADVADVAWPAGVPTVEEAIAPVADEAEAAAEDASEGTNWSAFTDPNAVDPLSPDFDDTERPANADALA